MTVVHCVRFVRLMADVNSIGGVMDATVEKASIYNILERGGTEIHSSILESLASWHGYSVLAVSKLIEMPNKPTLIQATHIIYSSYKGYHPITYHLFIFEGYHSARDGSLPLFDTDCISTTLTIRISQNWSTSCKGMAMRSGKF